jgi:hypothetical protein
LSNIPRPKLKTSALKRVTPDTRFYIDYEWWEKSDLDLKSYITTRLSLDEEINLEADNEEMDLVDAITGEVIKVDGFQYLIQTYFEQLPEDFAARTSLVDAVFCILLANANLPMTATELAKKVARPTETIIKTIGGPKIYQGIRPILDDD